MTLPLSYLRTAPQSHDNMLRSQTSKRGSWGLVNRELGFVVFGTWKMGFHALDGTGILPLLGSYNCNGTLQSFKAVKWEMELPPFMLLLKSKLEISSSGKGYKLWIFAVIHVFTSRIQHFVPDPFHVPEEKSWMLGYFDTVFGPKCTKKNSWELWKTFISFRHLFIWQMYSTFLSSSVVRILGTDVKISLSSSEILNERKKKERKKKWNLNHFCLWHLI